MTFATYFKEQLTDFVECYRKYFWQTIVIVLVLTVLCFVAIVLLLKFSVFDPTSDKKQISLLSYFFTRYSVKDTYSIVDLSKTVFVFFVSLFAVGLSRLRADESNGKKELSFGLFIKTIRFQDILTLVGILIVCSAADYCLFRVHSFSKTNITNHEFQSWVLSLFFLLRIYLPLIIFSITLFSLIWGKLPKITIKKLLFLFVSLWIFNEIAYEISIFVRAHIFSLILIPVGEENKYLYESLLGLLLIAFYFLGYYSAMTTSLKQLEEN